MNKTQLDIYVCTKSKCTAKRAAISIRVGEVQQDYNGPALLAALTQFMHDKGIGDRVEVHEATCMSGCPVGPRMDLCSGSQRVMYFRRLMPTGRADLVAWTSIESIEREIEVYLT
jgi:predicted metal-binding protein